MVDVTVKRTDFKQAAADASEKYKGSLDMIDRGVDYNDGNWHGWNGGECPVHPMTLIDVCLIDTPSATDTLAKHWFWDKESTRIRAFRVTKPYVEPPNPREFWINEYPIGLGGVYDSKAKADENAAEIRIRCIHVREVIEE